MQMFYLSLWVLLREQLYYRSDSCRIGCRGPDLFVRWRWVRPGVARQENGGPHQDDGLICSSPNGPIAEKTWWKRQSTCKTVTCLILCVIRFGMLWASVFVAMERECILVLGPHAFPFHKPTTLCRSGVILLQAKEGESRAKSAWGIWGTRATHLDFRCIPREAQWLWHFQPDKAAAGVRTLNESCCDPDTMAMGAWGSFKKVNASDWALGTEHECNLLVTLVIPTNAQAGDASFKAHGWTFQCPQHFSHYKR